MEEADADAKWEEKRINFGGWKRQVISAHNGISDLMMFDLFILTLNGIWLLGLNFGKCSSLMLVT